MMEQLESTSNVEMESSAHLKHLEYLREVRLFHAIFIGVLKERVFARFCQNTTTCSYYKVMADRSRVSSDMIRFEMSGTSRAPFGWYGYGPYSRHKVESSPWLCRC